jgi:Rab3 GTPase-activating protein catalytic subunit
LHHLQILLLSGKHYVPRLGVLHPAENLTMLETGEPVFSPIIQEGPVLTEDLIRETEELIFRKGSVGAGCSQLLSDMQAFKATNPGCILEDFVRWYSPPDWSLVETDHLSDETNANDEDLAGERTLSHSEEIAPSDFFEQLFIVVLSSGFIIAEALHLLAHALEPSSFSQKNGSCTMAI